MSMKSQIESNLKKLIEQGTAVLSGRRQTSFRDINSWATRVEDLVNRGDSIAWGLASITCIEAVYGENSALCRQATQWQQQLPKGSAAESLLGVLRAALDCWLNDYHVQAIQMASAEVFSDFLEMASSLLKKPYHPAASASLIGGVLEEHLRGMCTRRAISLTKTKNGKETNKVLGDLNTDLLNNQAYLAVKKQQVDAWITLRNKAAHGKWDEVEKDDVKRMLDGVQSFCADVS